MNKDMAVSRRNAVLAIGGTTSALAAALLFGWWQTDGPGASQRSGRSSILPLPLYEMDFQLTDHSGRTVSPDDWIGYPTLVFFGFTYCPDVCPTTLTDITGWLQGLGDDASRFKVAFITVDPERDTVRAMADYVSNFHPAIIGYTGVPVEIANAAKGFRVKYERVSTEYGYTINHTAGVFVYDASGEFVSIIDFHEPRENAIPKIQRALL